MDEAGEYRTRSASLRGMVMCAPTAGDAMWAADPFANTACWSIVVLPVRRKP